MVLNGSLPDTLSLQRQCSKPSTVVGVQLSDDAATARWVLSTCRPIVASRVAGIGGMVVAWFAEGC